jgi:hypothetical protein
MLAGVAHASYGQMRLDGLGLLLAFVVTVAYGLIVDAGLLGRVFRYRAAVIAGIIVALAVALLFLATVASPDERAGFFKLASGGSGRVLLLAVGVVFLPFIVIAPFAQHRAVSDGRRWPRWIGAWMWLQLALPPAFIVLGFADHYFRQRDYAIGYAEGHEINAGELGALLARADRKPERIWGTGWNYPWPQMPPARSMDQPSGWTLGVALGLDASALIATNEPLSAPDRAALRTLLDRHFPRYSVANIRAKALWDTLESGSFSATLDPTGVYAEAVPVLLERLETHGDARFCPDGRMLDADRAALNALLQAKSGAEELRPPWDGYQRRVERLCHGPG